MRLSSRQVEPPHSTTGRTVMRFSRRTFRPFKRTRRRSKDLRETTYEDCFRHCALSAWADVYGLWPERISQLHPPATTDEPACDTVLCCHQRVAFCRVLLRDAVDWRVAVAFRLLCAARAHGACGGVVQHPCLPPHAVAAHRSGARRLRAVGARLL